MFMLWVTLTHMQWIVRYMYVLWGFLSLSKSCFTINHWKSDYPKILNPSSDHETVVSSVHTKWCDECLLLLGTAGKNWTPLVTVSVTPPPTWLKVKCTNLSVTCFKHPTCCITITQQRKLYTCSIFTCYGQDFLYRLQWISFVFCDLLSSKPKYKEPFRPHWPNPLVADS